MATPLVASTAKPPAATEHDAVMVSAGMVRILEGQAAAIFPLELPIIQGYVERGWIPATAKVLSVGCGTGAFERRLLDAFPGMEVVGVDLAEELLAEAVRLSSRFGPRATWLVGNALHLSSEFAGKFDLCLNRHMIHLFSQADLTRCVHEMATVLRPGGVLHILAEDYGMVYFSGTPLDADVFWRNAIAFGAATGGDWRVGRHMERYCRDTGRFQHTSQTLISVDSYRDRAGTAEIFASWAASYTDIVASNSAMTVEECRAHWDSMMSVLREGSTTSGHAQWHIPIITAVVTGAA